MTIYYRHTSIGFITNDETNPENAAARHNWMIVGVISESREAPFDDSLSSSVKAQEFALNADALINICPNITLNTPE